ncbi:sugar ABC transporter permease [Nocardioides sp. 1609]|uniref:carbohydrate ABC transporter permease n=1 Tax=Nocardioides sp. 1609 TaxID=2508327 RepID=UPI001ADA1EF2|nr:sugar ABC transporter permease [Nocardioides sp. 1609]
MTAPAEAGTAAQPGNRPASRRPAGSRSGEDPGDGGRGGRRGERRLLRRERRARWDVKLAPYVFVSPFFLVFAVVGMFPLAYTGYLSLYDWDRLAYARGEFIGLDNFRWVLDDPLFTKSLVNTLSIFAMSSIPQVVIAVTVAALLDQQLRGSTFWRISVLLPFVVAPTAAVLIFGTLFSDRSGLVNELLNSVGLEPIRWHVERWWSHAAISSMVNWRWTGYNALIFLAAMQAVPREVYESASLDGAGRVRQLFHITLPMIRPTVIFVIVTTTIGGLQIFTEPRLFDDTAQREGGADHQYMTMTLYVYVKGIEDQFYGRASAAAWLLFLFIITIVLANYAATRWLTRRRAL